MQWGLMSYKSSVHHIGRHIVCGVALEAGLFQRVCRIAHVHVNVRCACTQCVWPTPTWCSHPPLEQCAHVTKGWKGGHRWHADGTKPEDTGKKPRLPKALMQQSLKLWCCTHLALQGRAKSSRHVRQPRASSASSVVVSTHPIADSNSNSAPPAGVGTARSCRQRHQIMNSNE